MHKRDFKNYLITTSIDIKKNDKNKILLGDWCLGFNKEEILNEESNKLIKYHWDDRRKFQNDYLLINDIYEVILEILRNELNYYHKTDFSKRYWRIIIGPWLGSILCVLFDRWSCLKIAKDYYPYLCLKISKFNLAKIIPQDTNDFYSKMTTDIWNKYIFELIAEEIGINIENQKKSINMHEKNKFPKKILLKLKKSIRKVIKKINRILKSFILNKIIFLLSIFINKKSQIILFGVSINLYTKIKLFIKDRRILLIPKFEEPKDKDIDFKFRKTILKKFKIDNANPKFINLLIKIIPLIIPKVFLENYKNINNLPYGILSKTNITSIITESDIYGNDQFKILSAALLEKGTKLIISQHGGNYGLGLFSFFDDHEYAISDYFLSWGWTLKNKNKIIPFGSLKLSNFKPYNKINTRKNGILLILMGLPKYSFVFQSITISSTQVKSYHLDQFKFASNLEDRLFRDLEVRLHPIDFEFNLKNKWKQRYPSIKFATNKKEIFKILKDYKVFICTYNATSLLELLFLNVPTIIFFDVNNWEIKESFKSYIDLLKEANILHESPEKAALFLSNNYDLIDEWWYSEKVQFARRKFCKNFAFVPKDLLNKLHKLNK